ncbi:uncharacterized protein LOC6526146 isoform X1 [Drosophila yakuba]|uniref:Uncharacterized protein, isoform A n=1 Tax=Drosophila yakuba TaxID=7245 RepID=B4PYM7_DROYA|nr:uncharacterized protein LOC6526146 isoform X1 [Drosophila yakuba]EDX03068.1 uncharacterized protein Dyak_GE15315, isoform A [Drosophila yakuba]KRK07086.1 uncharacterized protein Dyak_GE15315, isoform B [Drosophila yakuba]
MKVRQLPASTTTVSFRAKQRDVGGIGMPCERERKHEAAKREREEQLKRDHATAAAAAAAQRVRQHNRRISAEGDPAKRKIPQSKERLQAAGLGRPGSGNPSNVTGVSRGSSFATGAGAAGSRTERAPRKQVPPLQERIEEQDDSDAKAERLGQQLEELAAMSEQEFEVKFRQWLDQEGIAREMHSHLRVELIHCFNNTALGQLLSKAAGVQMAHSHALLLSPLAMVLHTLVAEFLHSQNCHFTLSVFCSETPHRSKLPDFRSRPEFRFQSDELQKVVAAILGEEGALADPKFGQLAEAHYEEDLAGQTQCLLMAVMRTLVEIRRTVPELEVEQPVPVSLQDAGCQTEPSACVEARPEVDTTGLYQAEEHELILGADGRSVFVGGRVSQSLHSVERQLNQLMKNLRHLAKSCAPPIEVISSAKFEDLLKKELRERERLRKAGRAFNPAETIIKIATGNKEEGQEVSSGRKQEDVVHSDLGPIQVPALDVAIPQLPRLHTEQLASLAVIRQSLDMAQKKTRQPQGRMYVSMERLETLMGDVCGCVQLLGNVLNLSMEQEHSVGMHKGFKLGYREGFAHGHFMGLQEGQKLEQLEEKKRQRERPPPKKREACVQTESTVTTANRATQTSRKSAHRECVITQTEQKLLKDAGNQATFVTDPSQKTYEQWIHEMLHSSSGQVFLERVELSLNKALELQKERLDELFQVKLRHQAEMVRLSRRQNSWRTLCKRVERDSQSSSEARDLVQKIFGLLEHYESHHQQLAEKIQQTELAAEQAARIMPMWADGAGGGSAPGNWNTAMSTTPITSGICTPAPPPAPAPSQHAVDGLLPVKAAGKPHVEQHTYPGLALLALAPPVGVPVAGAFVPVPSRLSAHFLGDTEHPVALVPVARIYGDRPEQASRPVPPSSVPAATDIVHPAAGDTNVSTFRTGSASRDLHPAENGTQDPATLTVPAPRDPSPPAPSVLPSSASLPLAPSDETAPPPAPAQSSIPPKPSMHSVATNTITPLPPKVTPLKPSNSKFPEGPSFEEALLSAKSRMLQLEQESDLLEHSFLSYLEKTKAKTSAHKSQEDASKTRRIRASCQREREQMHRTMDGFRDWHRRVRKEDAASLAQLEELHSQGVIPGGILDSKGSSPLWLSELDEGHEQDSYPFTNAITEARNKVLDKIMPVRKEEPKEKQAVRKNWLADLPLQIPEAVHPIKPPKVDPLLTNMAPDASSTGEMNVLLQRAKDALGLQTTIPLLDSSSSSSSSIELPSLAAGRSPSTKFQQSMARMQMLFGGAEAVKPAVASLPPGKSGRPVSAPTAASRPGLGEHLVLPKRPHTAPTLHTISENEPALHHLDVSTSSSSQSPSPGGGRSPGEAFEDLVTSAVTDGGRRRNAESSTKVSYSQAFWKRINL